MEKNKLNFEDLFTEYQERSAKNNNLQVKDNSHSNSEKNKPSEKKMDILEFINNPISYFSNKDENQKNYLKFINKNKDFYDLFKVFSNDDIKADYKEVYQHIKKHLIIYVMIALITSLVVSFGLTISILIAFLIGIFSVLMNDNKYNGVNKKIIYKKYKLFFAILLNEKKNIKSEEDLEKILMTMAYNNDTNGVYSMEDIHNFKKMLWPFLNKIDDKQEINEKTEDDLITLMNNQFNELLSKRNQSDVEIEQWDKLIDVFSTEKIKNAYEAIKSGMKIE